MSTRPAAPGRTVARAAALAVLCAAGTAGAQTLSLNRSGSGARAAGMANAFVAVSDDGTAASWNPAGLASLRKPEVSLVWAGSQQGFQMTGLRTPDGLTGYSNMTSSTHDSSLDFASVAVPFTLGRPITVQAGWHRLYQLNGGFSGDLGRYALRDPAAGGDTVFLDSFSRGDIDVWTLAGAMKLSSRLSLGGSLDVWRGDWTDRFTLVETAGAPTSQFLFGSTTSRVRGHNLAAGLLLTYPSWNVGLVYHNPFTARYGLHRESRSNLAPPQSLDGGDETRMHFPRSMGAGVAWRPTPRWRVAADVTADRWTDLLIVSPLEPGGVVNFFDEMPPDLSGTRDTVGFNLGAERLFIREGSVVPVRLGMAWEPQGRSDPFTRDSVSLVLLAGGVGFNTNSLKMDAALQYRWGAHEAGQPLSLAAAAGDPLATAYGRSRLHEWRLKVSVIYRVQDTDKLRDLLRKLFG
jgi:long-subunit fatty acid transport protein